MGGLLQKIGRCRYCGKLVSLRRSRDLLNRLAPAWFYVEGKGYFHKSCWKIYRKSIITPNIFEYQTPDTPLGKGAIKKKLY